MINFKHRSKEPELMDDLSLDQKSLQAALNDISKVNKLLGGNKITLTAIEAVISQNPNREYTIMDVGCGAGAMLREVADFCRMRGFNVVLIGVDMNSKSLQLAEKFSLDYPEISYKELNILTAEAELVETDILLCTLTLHHFNCEDIVRFLKRFQQITLRQIIINDLQRSRLAFGLFSLFSRIFLKTDIARHDGLISIKRGFLKEDINTYSKLAGLNSEVKWKWAFRYLWTVSIDN